MLLCSARTRSLVLFDFLAPGLNARGYSTNIPLKYDVPYSAIVETVRKRIAVTRGLPARLLSDPQVDIYNSTVMRIRQAVKDRNVHAVIDYWRHLDENKLIHFLGEPQLEKISELVATSFLPRSGKFEAWDQATRKLVEEIALRAASSHCTDALNMCMLFYIKNNAQDTVIDLYERFMKSLGSQQTWIEAFDAQEKKDGESLVADKHSGRTSLPFHPGRVSILLAVTTAYAMKHSFQVALDTCMNTTIPFHPFSTVTFLKELDHNPSLRQTVKVWVSRLNIARLVSRPSSLSRRIKRLAEEQAVLSIEKLYDAVIDGLSEPDSFLAADESRIASTERIPVNIIIWTSFLAGFMKCQRRDLAARLWDDMLRFGIRPGTSLWTALIDAYDSVHAVNDALASWNMMRAQNVGPDALTYRALISALFNGRKPDMALKIFREFRSDVKKDSLPVHVLSVYNTVLHGLLLTDRIQEANELFQSMQNAGINPDLVSYNTFLAYYGRRGDFKELATVVNNMAAADLAGDVFSFSTILSALLKAGRDDAATVILKLMRKQGIEPNVATYSAVIDYQIREGDERNIRAALLMLQQMELDPRNYPNEVTYTSVLAGIYRDHRLPPEKVEEWREDIVRRMKRRGIKFGLPAYHILLKACLKNPQSGGLQNAMEYYHEMKKRRIRLAQSTWYILLAGLLQREEWTVADEVVKDMYKAGVQPSGSVLELVSRIRKRLHYREP
ncbi:hypothetical protein AX17_000399 [Amanita inopinata Kibby_2008]|nr:hypothetical protein AX17_000399 [Amanita inopinata Kibby_2008]